MERTSDSQVGPLTGVARVRHEIAKLGTDAASAPEVPAAVAARIGAALRLEPPPVTRPGGDPGTAGPTLVL